MALWGLSLNLVHGLCSPHLYIVTTCHGTYRNRLPIQWNLALKAGQQSGCESLDVSSSYLTSTELKFSDHEIPVSITFPSSAQMTPDFYSVIKGAQIWFLLRVYLSSQHPTSKHECLKTTL